MKIVIDSNVLFSALIKNSITRKIILEYNDYFLFPSFVFDELEKHKEELLKKSKLSKEDFEKLLEVLLEKMVVVPPEVLIPYKNRALEIVKKIDIDDIVFVACILAFEDSILWSNDDNLKDQSEIRVLNTSEIIKLLN